MVMKSILEINLEGELDSTRLELFQKLLNLRSMARLTDTEDSDFGHRAVRDIRDEWVWLDLYRRDSSQWAVILSYTGPRPTEDVVARCRAEVLAAAEAPGLAVTGTWSETSEPVRALDGLELPHRRALSARLAGGERTLGWLDVDPLDHLQRALHLGAELGGRTGAEFGWRYVRWDPPAGSQLLQLYDDPTAGTEIAVLFDGRSPSADVVAGCRLQIEVAAAHAGMTLTEQHPEPPERPPHDWAATARRAASAETFTALLRLVGSSEETAYELTRGRLLAVTHQPGWAVAQPRLRWQVEDFLLGLPMDRL